MEFHYVEWAAREHASERHLELMRQRPDLLHPPFQENPVAMPEDFPFLFYASDEGRVVGSRKSMPDLAWIGGETRPWAWNFDAFVEPHYRGRGIGLRLLEMQLREIGRRGFISGASFSAPATMRHYQRLGIPVRGHAPRMSIVRRTRPFLHSQWLPPPFLDLASTLGDVALSTDRILRSFFHRGDRLELVRLDSARYEELLRKTVVRKQANYWDGNPNWILTRKRPSDAIIAVSRSRDQKPIVVFVVRQRIQSDMSRGRVRKVNRLSIMHFNILAEPEDAPRIFASAITLLLNGDRADVADVISSFPPLISALRARGFRSRGPGMSFCYVPPEQVQVSGTLADWHLTHFCSDGFMFD